MNKRTVYMPKVIHTLTSLPHLRICACTHGKCYHSRTAECQKYVLVDPAELAKLEAEARVVRAVIEWLERVKEPACNNLPLRTAHGYVAALSDLNQVIGKTKKGEGNE